MVFGPGFPGTEPQLVAASLVERIAGRHSCARTPMFTIAPVINATSGIEIHVRIRIIVVIVVRRFAVHDAPTPMNDATGGQRHESSHQQASAGSSQTVYEFCFHRNQTYASYGSVATGRNAEIGSRFFLSGEFSSSRLTQGRQVRHRARCTR